MKQRASAWSRMTPVLLMLLALCAGCDRQSADGTAGTGVEQARPPATAGKTAADAVITARVKAALAADPDLKSLEIKVDTVNAAVTLSGTIDTPHHLERATQVTKAVDGVKAVSNHLNVKAPT